MPNQSNPQAFPRSGFAGPSQQDGMTLRDYFAAKGLAVLSNNQLRPNSVKEMQHLACRLYQMADAMLAVREKQKST